MELEVVFSCTGSEVNVVFLAYKVSQRLCSYAQSCRGHERDLAKHLGGHHRVPGRLWLCYVQEESSKI